MRRIDNGDVGLRFFICAVAVLVIMKESNCEAVALKWTQRSAVLWDGSSPTLESCYWGGEVLPKMFSRSDEGVISISYEKLLVTANQLALVMREKVERKLVNVKANRQPVGVPIAVAISEGPLLPIAIVLVHALNHPARTRNRLTWFSVLVPLEPSEGKERLLHMVNDVQPSMILCLPGEDMDRMKKVLECNNLGDSGVSPQGLLIPDEIELVDMQELLRHALENEQADLSSRAKVFLSEASIAELQLQSLLARCASFATGDQTKDSCNFADPLRMSHVVFTSGTTGRPKGCVSSIKSLQHYLAVKNEGHGINHDSTVMLASALSFDPCLSDILSVFQTAATLAIAPRKSLVGNLSQIMQHLRVTHILCTPTLWSMVHSAGARPNDFPSLRVVALGGEPIPKQIRQVWAQSQNASMDTLCRLFSTYGVTEACVYQTIGEVYKEGSSVGQDVGHPFRGIDLRICMEAEQIALVDVIGQGYPSGVGEVVLCGSQIDALTSYLNRPDLQSKFARDKSHPGQYFYRTGDRGYRDAETGRIHIMGRIQGEEGMVKINGVRVELVEIENAVVDEGIDGLIASSIARPIPIESVESGLHTEIHLFFVVNKRWLKEVGFNAHEEFPGPGILVTSGPFLTLLRARCLARLKASCVPSAFVVISTVPISPTGKRDRRKLPSLCDCVPMDHVRGTTGVGRPALLREYGSSGAIVAEIIMDCLNLQPCQEIMLTSAASFSVLGGDSLAATRVMRALYAYHHNVDNTRHLGGSFGILDDSFDVIRLLRGRSLGSFVDHLDRNFLCRPRVELSSNNVKTCMSSEMENGPDEGIVNSPDVEHESQLYEALLQASASGQSAIACALLDIGADPNFGAHGGRLGKVSSRMEQKTIFRSSPLHLACLKGDDSLVKKLIEKQSKFNSPDASGLYPIHLAASSEAEQSEEEGLRRLQCVKLLFEAGVPLTMRDGNKQTVLHAAARAGQSHIIRYVMNLWKERHMETGPIPERHYFNWTDRWFRKCVLSCQNSRLLLSF